MSERLTDAQIDALTGRELDAVIADRVFGYAGIGYYGPTKPHGCHQDYALMSKEEAEAAYLEHWKGDCPGTHRWDPERDAVDILHWREGWGPLYIPDWSEDIDAAWELVERLREGGWEMNLSVNSQTFEPWDCRLFVMDARMGAPKHRVIAHGATGAESIARAALKALEATPCP